MATHHLATFIHNRSHNAIEREQLICYLVATALVVVGMSLHLFGILGADLPTLNLLTTVYISASLVFFTLWFFHKLSLPMAFSLYGITAQAVQTVRMLFLTFTTPAQFHFLIIGNGIVCMGLMILLAISYLRVATLIVGIANTTTIIFCCAIIGNNVLYQFAILVTMFSVFFVILTELMYRNVKHMQDENNAFRKGEHELLHILRLNRKEVLAYIEMCRSNNPKDADTDRLFSMLNEASQRNVINAVERKKAIDASRTAELKTLFPTFTPMELEVSRLILRDMKLKQIMILTGKNESNISTVRSHIRKKMGLTAEQDLRTELLKRTGNENK